MSAVVIDLQQAEDLRDVIHQTVEAISNGQVVALPTETVYGLAASALHPEAVQRVFEIKGRAADKPLAIAAKSLEDAMDYVPDMSVMARRIARRAWPGPLTLVLPASHPDSVIHRLDPRVQEATVPSGRVGLRVPAHELMLQVMRLCAGPIVLTSANPSGAPDPTSGQAVVESLGDQIDLILDDGPCQLGKASTVVSVEDHSLKILRAGNTDAQTLKKLTNFIGLVVCTGNTCRSPMGEALLKKLIADKIGCNVDELVERGVQIASAGIAAMPGAPATQQAVHVMQSRQIEIGDHASQPITGRLAHCADLILTMTRHHRDALISHWPLLEPRIRTVRRDGGDISDPIGSPVEVYQQCANQIEENLQAWVDELDWSQFS